MNTTSSRLLSLLVAVAALAPCLPAQSAAPAPDTTTAPAKAAVDVPTTLGELRKAIDERLAAINAGADVPDRFDWTALDGRFDELSTGLRNSSAQEAKSRLRELSGNLKSPEAKAIVARLGAALDAELNAADTARQAALEQKFTAISRAALAAQKPEELDPLFNQLEDLQQEINEQRGPRQSRNHNILNRQQNFLNSWQNLLTAAADGDRQSIRNAESNLGGGYSRAHGVDRSAIRARVRELSASAMSADNEDKAVIASLTLDNLAEVRDRLASLNENFGWNNANNQRMQTVAALDQLRSATLALEAGDVDLALRHLGGSGTIYHGTAQAEILVPLQNLRTIWLERSLPAITGLKGFPAANEKEFPEPYLRRLVLAADATGDHDRATALARVLRRIEFRFPTTPAQAPSGDDLAGAYENYVAARRLEAAGQGEDAAKAYRAAIVAGSPAGLTAEISGRLKTLGQP